jgi:hypothetical protein
MPTKQMILSNGTEGTEILKTNPKKKGLEPSGLAYFGGKIYIPSDNGLIASMSPDGTGLTTVYTKPPEVESVMNCFSKYCVDNIL